MTIGFACDTLHSILRTRFSSDEEIAVGADLYAIDTEAEGTVASPQPSAAGEEKKAETEPSDEAPKPAVAIQEVAKSSHTRSPSIHFLGKNGWAKRLIGQKETPSVPTSPAAVVTLQGELHPMYGRPKFTEKEMEALILGGAETAPTVISTSDGAQFAV